MDYATAVIPCAVYVITTLAARRKSYEICELRTTKERYRTELSQRKCQLYFTSEQ